MNIVKLLRVNWSEISLNICAGTQRGIRNIYSYIIYILIYILVNLNLLYKIMLIHGQDVCSTDFSFEFNVI